MRFVISVVILCIASTACGMGLTSNLRSFSHSAISHRCFSYACAVYEKTPSDMAHAKSQCVGERACDHTLAQPASVYHVPYDTLDSCEHNMSSYDDQHVCDTEVHTYHASGQHNVDNTKTRAARKDIFNRHTYAQEDESPWSWCQYCVTSIHMGVIVGVGIVSGLLLCVASY